MVKRCLGIVLAVCLCLGLVGCGGGGSNASAPSSTPAQTAQPTAEKISYNRDEAVPADFVQINGGNWYGKSVSITGQVTVIDKEGATYVLPNFTTSQPEGDGYGVYIVVVTDKTMLDKIADGQTVTVYGSVYEPDEKTGLPVIVEHEIEL